VVEDTGRDEDGNFKVSQSKVKRYRNCRYAYHLKYVEGFRKKRKARPLQFGSIVHKMIETYAGGQDPFKMLDAIEVNQGQMFRSQIDELGNIIRDIGEIMEDYFEYWEEREDDITYLRRNGILAEHLFEVEIAPGIVCKGKFDAFVRSKGLRWLAEHKTFGREVSEDHRWRDIQSCIYIRVNDMLGYTPVDGTLWDYIYSKAPTEPKVLKSGALSTKNVNTLPSTVRRVLRENRLPRSRAKALIQAAENHRSKYFKRVYTPRKDAVIDVLFSEFIDTAKEMSELHGKSKTRNIGKHCDYCEFEAICRAELMGHDVDFVKDHEYTTEPEDETTIEPPTDE
jgi:hypothetical protein